MTNLTDIKTVYESPDGGKTVYAREFGTNKKRIVSSVDTNKWHYYIKNKDWDGLAEEHPSIKDALEKLRVIEALCS